MQVYGKENKFDAARLIDLLGAYETFAVASTSARGSMDEEDGSSAAALQPRSAGAASPSGSLSTHGEYRPLPSGWPQVRVEYAT